jgi:hypothetical protein
MLTTEKLFRGDTEFALMEKVRKAEVPPPSKFNRRVPEALDKIVLRALARDLPDRYQSAKDLGDDLASFMGQYRFNPTEMQELMRNLFRVDFQKESDEIDACRIATLGGPEAELEIETPPLMPASPQRPTVPLPQRERFEEPAPAPPPPDNPPEPPKPAGLWSRLRGKFSK